MYTKHDFGLIKYKRSLSFQFLDLDVGNSFAKGVLAKFELPLYMRYHHWRVAHLEPKQATSEDVSMAQFFWQKMKPPLQPAGIPSE